MKKQALIIENNHCHHELLPTWIWLLTNKMYDVTLVISHTIPEYKNITNFMMKTLKLPFTLLKTIPKNLSIYHVIIFNTSVLQKYELQRGTKFIVMHNDRDVDVDDNAVYITLGLNMYKKMSQIINNNKQVLYAPPIYFGHESIDIERYRLMQERRNFVVQGNLEPFRRNYNSLPKLINKFASFKLPTFQIRLIGDSTNSTSHALVKKIFQETQYKTHLALYNNIDYHQFFNMLRRETHWIIPCIDDTFEHDYFDTKITSSVMMAVGHSIPLIIHQKLAAIYDLKDDVNCICYTDEESMYTAFLKALTLNSESYQIFCIEMNKTKNSWLEKLKSAF